MTSCAMKSLVLPGGLLACLGSEKEKYMEASCQNDCVNDSLNLVRKRDYQAFWFETVL